jgi:putative MATE family efflux protein
MYKSGQSVLDTDKIGRLLLKLATPSFMGMFVVMMYNVVNTIFIGHYIGWQGIAGLSIVFPFQMLGMGCGQLAGMGGASIVSRALGAHDMQRAEKTLGNALFLGIVIGLILTVVGLSATDFWLTLSGASESILPYSRDYMVIIYSGIILGVMIMCFNGLMISEGNTRIVMVTQITGAGLNIVMDALFIIVFGWGVKGAALGTVISQATSTIIFVSYYLAGRTTLKIKLQNMIPDWKIIRQILAIGVSAFANTMASSLTSILVMRLLESYGGDMAVSTFGILNRIMMFSVLPAIVIGQGLQPIIGYNYGAKRYDRVLKGIKIAAIASTAICTVSFLIFYFMPELFVKIFTSDAELITRSAYAIKRAFFFLYIVGIIFIGNTIFLSTGLATRAFATSLARSALILIPVLFIMSHFFQLEGIWLTFPISDLLSFLLILGLILPQIAKLRRQNEEQKAALAALPAERTE